MKIKMRISKKDCECSSCGISKEESLDMFDVMIGESIFHLCDLCMRELNGRSLSAICYTNGRVKQPRDIRVSNARKRKMRQEGYA